MDIAHTLTSAASLGVEFGLLNALLVVGTAIAFRFANFPDLTIEGSVTVGAAVSALATAAGWPSIAAVALGAMAGGLAGLGTALLHLWTRTSRLLAGIIMMTVLYAVSLRLLSGSNLPLFDMPTMYARFSTWLGRCLCSAAIVVLVLSMVVTFLQSEFGLLLRATGENLRLARKLGFPCNLYLVVSLVLANALVGTSGAMLSQYNRFADVGFGSGAIITALAALLIGETLVVPTSVLRQMAAAIVGAVVYYSAYALALGLGVHPWDLKLVSGALLVAAIVATRRMSAGRFARRIGADPL